MQQIVPTSVANVTSYYVTCAGSNPMNPSLQAAEELVADGERLVTDLLGGVCAGNVYLEQALTVFHSIDVVFANITTSIACPPLQAQFQDVLNTGLCEQSFRGLYTIWVGQFVSTACLLAATIFVALLYQYFNPHWDVKGLGSARNSRSGARNSNNNLLFMEQSPENNGGAPAGSSPNEYYYSTSSLHTSGEYASSNNVVPTNDAL